MLDVYEQFNLLDLLTKNKVLRCNFSVMARNTPLVDDVMSLSKIILNLEVNNIFLNITALRVY